jgi:uroporphyrinogen III methyltransferase/synthase
MYEERVIAILRSRQHIACQVDYAGSMAVAVLTRDPVDAQAYASTLAPLGLDVLAMPVTKTVSAADRDALTRALDTGEYAAIVVASPRAAHELSRAVVALAGVRTTLPFLPDVWAVGPATKRALDIARLPAHHPADVRDGAELARKLVATQSLAGKRVLVPRAEEGRVEALEILRAAGADVVDVIAYRTVAVAPDDPTLTEGADTLVRGGAAICALFAPSQVTALAAVMAARDHELAAVVTQFCAIGETTATALRVAGVRDVTVATAPSPEGMAHAVRSVYPSR